MRHSSPFSINRFEYEPQHIYYLEADVFRRLTGSDPKPVYLVGARGTGKTTLLKALHWKERLSNESLQRQLGDAPLASQAGPFVGVYINLPDHLLRAVETWVYALPIATQAMLIAMYLDLLWLEEASRAVAELTAKGTIRSSPSAELMAVERIASEFTAVWKIAGGAPRSIRDLSARLKNVRSFVEQAALSRVGVDEIAEQMTLQQPGSFGRSIAAELADFCAAEGDGGVRWHFKVCFDQGEVLSDTQQRTLNSMIRLTKWPVFMIVAFVSMPADPSGTVLDGLTLQAADCDIFDLSELVNFKRFRELAEGVATARVEYMLKARAPVSIAKILGSTSLNEILASLLSESVAPESKALLERARRLANEPFIQHGFEDETETDQPESLSAVGELPIYQAYLIDKLNITMPHPDEPTWWRRRQESAELRKRMVAAYLSICSDLQTDVRFCSAPVVLRLCDLCIRDFLKFMNAIHHQSGLAVADFIDREVDWRIQHEALRIASKEKATSVRNQGLSFVRETEAVVKGLALMTHHLQSHSDTGEHLRSSERGVYVFPAERFRDREDKTARVIRDACEQGYLRVLQIDDDKVSVRVHASLAPAFNFSYRGAYYPAPMRWSDIDRLRRVSTDLEVEDIISGVLARSDKNVNLTLFGDA